jgi:hypothetical protein
MRRNNGINQSWFSRTILSFLCVGVIALIVLTSVDLGITTKSTISPIYEKSGSPLGHHVDLDCTFSKGFWKNHPEAWPQDWLLLGHVNYTKTQLLYLFSLSAKEQHQIIGQLIATKLNILNGADSSSIAPQVDEADTLIGAINLTTTRVSGSKTQLSFLNGRFADFNEGYIGPGKCDGAHCPFCPEPCPTEVNCSNLPDVFDVTCPSEVNCSNLPEKGCKLPPQAGEPCVTFGTFIGQGSSLLFQWVNQGKPSSDFSWEIRVTVSQQGNPFIGEIAFVPGDESSVQVNLIGWNIFNTNVLQISLFISSNNSCGVGPTTRRRIITNGFFPYGNFLDTCNILALRHVPVAPVWNCPSGCWTPGFSDPPIISYELFFNDTEEELELSRRRTCIPFIPMSIDRTPFRIDVSSRNAFGFSDPDSAIFDKQFETVDSVGNVGHFTSLAILPSGFPAISYYDVTNRDLKYAKFNGASWILTTVDSVEEVGEYTSLAILPNGFPAISYHDLTNNDLKYAKFNGTSWILTTVDSLGNVGEFTSLAILPNGFPVISYHDVTNLNLKYAEFNGISWILTTVDSVGTVGEFTSLAILPNGFPVISYQDGTNFDLKYAEYNGISWILTTVDSGLDAGLFTSLAILPNGFPAISYFDRANKDLKYAEFDGISWMLTTVDSGLDAGLFTSLAILPNEFPAISYFDRENQDLKFFHIGC